MEKKSTSKKISETNNDNDMSKKLGFRKYTQKIKDQAIRWHKEGKKSVKIVIELDGKGPKIKAVKRGIHKFESRR